MPTSVFLTRTVEVYLKEGRGFGKVLVLVMMIIAPQASSSYYVPGTVRGVKQSPASGSPQAGEEGRHVNCWLQYTVISVRIKYRCYKST